MAACSNFTHTKTSHTLVVLVRAVLVAVVARFESKVYDILPPRNSFPEFDIKATKRVSFDLCRVLDKAWSETAIPY